MIAKKFALAFGIAVVFPAMIHYGVSTFSLEPRWQDYHVASLIDSNSAEYQKKDVEYRAAERTFEKHLFATAVPLGLITVIVGAFLALPSFCQRIDVRRHLQRLRRLLQLLVGAFRSTEVLLASRGLYRSASRRIPET